MESGTEGVDSGTEGVDSGTEGVDSGTEGVDSGTKGFEGQPRVNWQGPVSSCKDTTTLPKVTTETNLLRAPGQLISLRAEAEQASDPSRGSRSQGKFASDSHTEGVNSRARGANSHLALADSWVRLRRREAAARWMSARVAGSSRLSKATCTVQKYRSTAQSKAACAVQKCRSTVQSKAASTEVQKHSSGRCVGCLRARPALAGCPRPPVQYRRTEAQCSPRPPVHRVNRGDAQGPQL
eukprot:1192061-Prorocentrum_minimum.AAC.1